MNWTYKNELEYDWCISALNCVQSELKQMRGSHWLFYAWKVDSVLEAMIRFLLSADHQLGLGLSVTVLANEGDFDATASLFPFASVRNIGLQKEPIVADYCVYCGYDACEDPSLPHPGTLDLPDVFWKQIAKPTHRAICISGSKVYSPYPYPIAAAEGEYLRESSCTACHFARESERLVCETQSNYVILRPGIILGAGAQIASPVTDLLDRLIQGEVGPISAQSQYSMVYMTDFLTALILSAAAAPCNTVYNVCHPQATASLLSVAQLYLEQYPQSKTWNLELICEPGCTNHALSSSKLQTLLWQPLVDLPTMITLEIKARTGSINGLWFTDGHQGKLPAIHSCLLRILCEIDRICKKYDIRYFLAGGTLLGAVRHQGFIPWDDDLDIMMLRDDYTRFLEAARKELPPEMFLQSPQDEPGDHYLISKIRLQNTVFSSEFLLRYPQLNNGVFVDIIAQDYTANSAFGQKIHLKLTQLARGLVFKKWSGGSAAAKGKRYAIFDLIIRLVPISALERFQHWVLTLFDGRKDRRFLFDSMGINLTKGVYPANWLSEQINVTFEGRSFPAPRDYDAYLRYLYGEYTQSVPVTQRRVVHDVPWFDLGPYADDPLS